MITLNSVEYREIATSDLIEGTYIDYNIYYKTTEGLTLLCNNVILNKLTLSRLIKITTYSSNGKVYVPCYTKPLSFHTQVEENVAIWFHDVQRTKTINQELMDNLVNSLEAQLTIAETSMLIRSINTMKQSDGELYLHSMHVATLNGLLGMWLGYTQEKIKKLVLVGLLHDIGKINIQSNIIDKKGRLTAEEWETVKQHPQYSVDFLKSAGITDEEILQGVLQHHERPNGTGYPNHLPLSKICALSRVTAVSDVYDAMVSRRCYKEAESPFKVLDWFATTGNVELGIRFVNKFIRGIVDAFLHAHVALSDGRIGRVIHIPDNNIKYPIVKIGQDVIQTGESLYCVNIL